MFKMVILFCSVAVSLAISNPLQAMQLNESGPVNTGNVNSFKDSSLPESIIYISKTGRWYSKGNISGLAEISVKLVSNGKVIEEVFAVSGRQGKQNFRIEKYSMSGSREPAPEMVYSIPEGPVDVPTYHRNYGALGPWWIWIDFESSSSKAPRQFIGLHTDFDSKYEGKGGTLGCIATHNVTDIRKIVSWFRGHFSVQPPKNVIVDWGKGTVSAPL